jgi:dihydrodipicolinate synthase/N-acetylneuraminate lyase
VHETDIAARLGYDAILLSLSAFRDAGDDAMLEHCRAVAQTLPLFGFYLQPAVGGRVLGYDFWRRFAEIPEVVAIKIAPFNRYRTLDVVRAVIDAGRDDIALYTGNDDSIVVDLLSRFPFGDGTRRIVGGLLGQWAIGTRHAVEMVRAIRQHPPAQGIDPDWLSHAAALTDLNAALFDVSHDFAGCIAGIHEVLQRQGLLAGPWCLDPAAGLSPGQRDEIDRVLRHHPELCDNAFIAEHRERWLT